MSAKCAHISFFLYNVCFLLYNGTMKKLREICSSPWFLIAAQIVLSGAVAVGAVFYTYANVIAYRLWKAALIELTFALCCGGLFALTYFAKRPDAKALQLAFAFVIGFCVFFGIFFVLFFLQIFVNETVACVIGVSVMLLVDLACVIAQDIFAIRRDRMFLRLITVAVVGAVYVGAVILSCVILPHGWVFKSFSREKNEFAAASAESYAVTDADREANLTWMQTHLTGEGAPAFDFSLGGKKFRDTLSEWVAVVEKDETDGEGNVDFVKVFSSVSGVVARLEAKYYAQTATVEWTVFLQNNSMSNSAELTDLYALNASLPLSSPTLYFSGGSNEANDDFALYSRKLGKKELVFDTIKGRSSMLYLPFFNLSANEGGATIGVGWSGEWTAVFSSKKETSVLVGQSALSGYLAPGESVRTPLVSLSLYAGDPVKGFNNFRADIRRGLGDRATESSMLMFAGAEGQDDTSMANADGTKAYIQKLDELGVLYSLDYAWYDAAWYDTKGTGDWRQSVGDWKVDPAKYPEGLGAVSTYLKQKGVKTLLWYEPERVPMASDLYKTISATVGRKSWLILPANGSNDCLWNMGDPDALAYMTDYIASSLIENGVSYYRQDFNIDPKTYWERADRELYDGRTGFAENKYVTGEYAFLDALAERIPGLKIDNCASGGRRIDLEMCRRAVPLWRSDYQCKKEKGDLSKAAQYQLYGLGMWLPYSCITNPNATTEYDFRSLLGGYIMFYGDVLYNSSDTYVKFIREYEQIKTYFAQNYYPLTSCTPRSKVVAMQFGNAQEGVVLVYVRSASRRVGKETIIYPSGLSPDSLYEFRYIEGDVVKIRLGKEIMQNGISVSIDAKEAFIITYHEA